MNTLENTLPQPSIAQSELSAPKASSGKWKRYLIAALAGGLAVVLLLVALIIGLMVIDSRSSSSGAELISLQFDPVSKPTLKIGSSLGVSQSNWPKKIETLTYSGAGSRTFFSSEAMGSARYTDAQKPLNLDITLVPYNGAADYSAKINQAMTAHGGDNGHSMTSYGATVIFGVPETPSERLVFCPLQHCFLAITASKTSAEEWDPKTLEHMTDSIIASIALPATIAVGFPSYDEEKKGDLPYLRGPVLNSAEKWPSLDPSDDHFSQTRSGLALPQEFAHLTGDGVSYSALNLEANARRQIDAYFVPCAAGASEEDTFQSVIQALADESNRVPHTGYRYFTLTKKEQDVSWGAVHFIVEKEGICAVTACDNGVIICRTPSPAADEPAGALPDPEEVAYNLVTKLTIKWNDLQTQTL